MPNNPIPAVNVFQAFSVFFVGENEVVPRNSEEELIGVV